MLTPRATRGKSSSPPRFCLPPWNEDNPDFRRIDDALPADHHARWLAHVVSQLDLTAFRASYGGRGSPAYLPELLLAFVLFMYSKGFTSPALWANQALYDDQAKWLLRGLRPSRSFLYTFRDRVEPYLDDWHARLIAWALAEGITAARRGSLDGTLLASLASRHRLLSPRRADGRLLLLRLLVWFDQHPIEGDRSAFLADLAGWDPLSLGSQLPLPDGAAAADVATLLSLLSVLEPVLQGRVALPPGLPAWVPASAAGRQRVLRRYELAQQRLQKRLEAYQGKKKPSKKDQEAVKRLKVSVTDPEAALGIDKLGTYRPLYNVALVQATDAALTLAWDVLGCNNDQGLIQPMMEKTRQQVGEYLKELLVDGGFLNVSDVVWCGDKEIVIYAPPPKGEPEQAKAGPEGAGQAKEEPKEGEKYAKESFSYDEAEQVYRCPQGKRLEEAYRTKEKRSGGMELPVIVHRASGKDCQACPEQKRCTSNPKKGRVVKRYEGEEAVEALERRMREPGNRKVYKERASSVELGYADLKEHRGLRVFRGFGLKRARVQVGLVLLASNGLKILRALQQRSRNGQEILPAPQPTNQPEQPLSPQEKGAA